MKRERALKLVLVVVGLIFSAGIYPVTESLRHQNQSMYTFGVIPETCGAWLCLSPSV